MRPVVHESQEAVIYADGQAPDPFGSGRSIAATEKSVPFFVGASGEKSWSIADNYIQIVKTIRAEKKLRGQGKCVPDNRLPACRAEPKTVSE